jgi:hypothetical protein
MPLFTGLSRAALINADSHARIFTLSHGIATHNPRRLLRLNLIINFED